MKRAFTAAAAAAIAAVLVPACIPAASEASLQTSDAGTPTGILVTGHGEATGTPDVLAVTAGVSVLDKSVDEAVLHASRAATAVRAALSHAGVADKDVQTSSYAIAPEYAATPPDKRQLTGYRVTNTVEIKIRDLAHAGQVLDQVSAAGRDDVVVSNLRFTIENADPLLTKARDKAWNDAYAKASEIAHLAGQRLGAPTSIREESPSRPLIIGRSLAMAEIPAAPVTPIEPGELRVNVDLQVQFGFAGAPASHR